MIEYIKGELTELTPALAVVEAAGVGYGMNISLNTFSAIQGKKDVKLYVYESIREDAHVLFGFASKKEREMFLLLITVSGVGPNTARMVLSSMSPAELCDCISTGNERMIKTIKGIGPKVASCILIFSYARREGFPMDTWMKQCMAKYYSGKDKSYFHPYEALSQQYLFSFMRS